MFKFLSVSMYVLSEVDPVVGGFTAFTICKVLPSTRAMLLPNTMYIPATHLPIHRTAVHQLALVNTGETNNQKII